MVGPEFLNFENLAAIVGVIKNQIMTGDWAVLDLARSVHVLHSGQIEFGEFQELISRREIEFNMIEQMLSKPPPIE